MLKKISPKGVFCSFIFILFGNTLYALGVQYFIQPIGLFAGGITGIAQLTNYFLYKLGMPTISLGYLTILYNIPFLIFGYLKLDRRFLFQTLFSVLYVGILLNIFKYFPITEITQNVALNILFGGFLVGSGLGLTLKYGSSLGGTDIISNYLIYKKDTSVGVINTLINFIIVFCAYLLDPTNIDRILITILLFSYLGYIINTFHTKHLKYTVYIISDNYSIIIKNIYLRCGKGSTLLKAKTGYKKEEKYVIMTVISSYKIQAVKSIIEKYDKYAFVNIVPSKAVYGNFIKQKTEVPIIYK